MSDWTFPGTCVDGRIPEILAEMFGRFSEMFAGSSWDRGRFAEMFAGSTWRPSSDAEVFEGSASPPLYPEKQTEDILKNTNLSGHMF